MRFWGQDAVDRVLFAPLGGPRSPDSGLIPIFQTVSPLIRVNNGKEEAQRSLHRSPTGCLSREVRYYAEVVARQHALYRLVENTLAVGDIERGTMVAAADHYVVDPAPQLKRHLATSH